MPSPFLTEPQVRRIKERLWNGETAESIATEHEPPVSIWLILNVSAGHRWGRIPWPDGTIGKLDPKRRAEITKARREVRQDSAARVKRKLSSNKA